MKTFLFSLIAFLGFSMTTFASSLENENEIIEATASSSFTYNGTLTVAVNGQSEPPATTQVQADIENGKLTLSMGAVTIFGQTVYTVIVSNIAIDENGVIAASNNVPVTAAGFSGLTANVSGTYVIDKSCSVQMTINNVPGGKSVSVDYVGN